MNVSGAFLEDAHLVKGAIVVRRGFGDLFENRVSLVVALLRFEEISDFEFRLDRIRVAVAPIFERLKSEGRVAARRGARREAAIAANDRFRGGVSFERGPIGVFGLR